MKINCGEIHQLKVLRKTDIGYMLTDGEAEIFLHFNESMHRELGVDDLVDAFLYYDQKGRVTATLGTPLITLTRPARLKVVSINPDLGVFLSMGISKDLLMSKDDLPLNESLWPHINDEIYVKMIHKNRLTVRPVTKEDINNLNELEIKGTYEAVVQKIGHSGLNLLTFDDVWVYVHESMFKESVWIGKKVEVTVTNKSEKGYIGSLLKQKQNQMVDDADIVLKYLIKHKRVGLDSNSSPEDIKRIFNMSKKAFKRAIGVLYKQRRVDFVDGKTILL